MLKKSCLIEYAIKIIKDIAFRSCKIDLWISSENRKSTFNDTYIIYNLINSAEKKLKIELLRKLKNNYPIPLIMMREGEQIQLFEEHFWIHNEAFNIASMTFGN